MFVFTFMLELYKLDALKVDKFFPRLASISSCSSSVVKVQIKIYRELRFIEIQ